MAAFFIPGLVFFGVITLIALAETQNVQTKAQTESTGSILQFFKDAITGKALVHQITTLTRAAVSRWALANMKPVTAWFVAMNTLLLNIFRTQTQVIEGTATAVERLKTHTIPQAAGQAAAPAKKIAKAAQTKANTASATANATSTALHGYRVKTAPKIAHAAHAIDVVIPGQVGAINREIDRLRTDQTKLRERTTSLESGAVKAFEWIRTHPFSAVTGVFAGAVAIALTRLGYGFLRCRSWRNVGRGLTCGMGSLLSDLLALAIDVLLVADICQITQKMISVAESSVVQTALRGIVDGTEELMLCQGVKAPPALAGYWTPPPPLQTFSTLPA